MVIRMSVLSFALKEKSKVTNILNVISFNRDFYQKHPNYFRPDGLLMFCGPQGSGKTLSAVNYVYKLLELYPYAKIVTNVELQSFPIVRFCDYIISKNLIEKELSKKEKEQLYQKYLEENRVFLFQEAKDLTRYKNGFQGIIYLIDEIQLYFNSLGSKNIDMDVMKQISQQRKQRIHIVATSQVFGRMSKQLREQFDTVIYCEKKFFGYMQKNSLIDRDSIDSQESTGTNLKGTVKKVYRYFKDPTWFNRYDTYKVIENKNIKIEREAQDIYDNTPN